jgi:hypothetical protein
LAYLKEEDEISSEIVEELHQKQYAPVQSYLIFLDIIIKGKTTATFSVKINSTFIRNQDNSMYCTKCIKMKI